MLSQKKYPAAYISSCKKKITAAVNAWAQLPGKPSGFEHLYFENQVLILERMFIHRMRGQEGKDGNPLNEVRMLAASILADGGKFQPDKTIRYDAENSVTKIKPGQSISLTAEIFIKLSEAYFEEIKKRFG